MANGIVRTKRTETRQTAIAYRGAGPYHRLGVMSITLK